VKRQATAESEVARRAEAMLKREDHYEQLVQADLRLAFGLTARRKGALRGNEPLVRPASHKLSCAARCASRPQTISLRDSMAAERCVGRPSRFGLSPNIGTKQCGVAARGSGPGVPYLRAPERPQHREMGEGVGTLKK
jgi:hypothetical protein